MNVRETLNRALECDQEGLILQALHFYEEGIARLLSLLEQEKPTDGIINELIEQYRDRVDDLRLCMIKRAECGELIMIDTYPENSTGHGYQKLLKNYLGEDIKEILLTEPSFANRHQIQDLVHFLEIVVMECPNIKCVRVETNPALNQSQINHYINDIEEDLNQRGVTLKVAYDKPVRETKIVMDNGRIIEIEPSLHYFKKLNGGFNLGLYEYDLRRCDAAKVFVYAPKIRSTDSVGN